MGKNSGGHGSELLELDLPAFGTIYADPPWRMAGHWGSPDRGEKYHYDTMTLDAIAAMPVVQMAKPNAHLYLWAVNSLLEQGLAVMSQWGFTYKTHLVWSKVRGDGGIDRGGLGNYFRSAAELLLFGVRGSCPTLSAGRRQPSVVAARRREHSRKPDQFWRLIERCSPGPRLELFARYPRTGWYQWGNQLHQRMYTAEPRDGSAPPTTVVCTSSNHFLVYRGQKKR